MTKLDDTCSSYGEAWKENTFVIIHFSYTFSARTDSQSSSVRIIAILTVYRRT